MADLTPTERFMLDWLSKADWAQLGECKGRTLDRLLELGLAEINDAAIPQGREDWRGVRLTEAGWAALGKARAT